MKVLQPPVLQTLLWEIVRSQRLVTSQAGASMPNPQADNTLMLWADPSIPPAVLLRLAKHKLVRDSPLTGEPVAPVKYLCRAEARWMPWLRNGNCFRVYGEALDPPDAWQRNGRGTIPQDA